MHSVEMLGVASIIKTKRSKYIRRHYATQRHGTFKLGRKRADEDALKGKGKVGRIGWIMADGSWA